MSSEENAAPNRVWSLVCSTQEEWQELAEKFAKSENKNEKNLHQTLTVGFLAEITRMLEAKVRLTVELHVDECR